MGPVEVSERHGNFIVANQGATSEDVMRLIDLIATTVEDKLDVKLEREIEVW